MIRVATSRTMWVKRTTVFCVGLVVMLASLGMLLAAKPAHADTFTVNSTGDGGDNNPGDTLCFVGGFTCTLRAAIQEANHPNNPGADTINFNIAGNGPHTISPASLLPDITDPLTIDGYSQGKITADPADDARPATSTSNAVLKIALSSDAFVGQANGLKITAANSTVKGLVINGWQAGVIIDGSGATRNKVQGNYIGTDVNGTADVGNGDGVVIQSAPNNTVGGTDADDGAVDGVIKARNVISGNVSGVQIEQDSATGNKVQGNYIGTNASGTQKLGNFGSGVFIANASTNTIGGTTAGARNIISGNGSAGVVISSFGGGGAENNKIEGNYIGTDKNGTADLGNSASGVNISGAATNNFVGGTASGASNVIAFNGRDGVEVSGQTSTGNRILSNSINDNGGLGIDLSGDNFSGDGVTPNDPGDPDAGGNGLQNYPVITDAVTSPFMTIISGQLNSTPNKTFTLQFFSNPPGGDEGRQFIGQQSVTTDANGNTGFTFGPEVKVPVGQTITATATRVGGSSSTTAAGTSEFSQAKSLLKNPFGTRFRPGSTTKHTGFVAFRVRSLLPISSTPAFSTGSRILRTSSLQSSRKFVEVAPKVPYLLLFVL